VTTTFTAVPPDSTGDKLAMRSYTVGPDVLHSQGVHYDGLPTFGLLCEGTALAANAYHLYLGNNTGSNQLLHLMALYLINTATAAITGGVARFNLLRVTGAPTLTAVTPFAFDTALALSGVTAGRAVTTGLTDGQILLPIVLSSDEHTAAAGNVQQLVNAVNHLAGPATMRPKIIRPGEAVAVRQITAVTAGSLALLAHFAVEPI
jgi:hypothetical protein